METDVRVSADGDMVVLSIPEEDETAVREKVEAHVPQARQASSPTAADVIAALAAMTLENVTTVEDLKAAIQPIRETAVAVIGAEQAQGGERQ
jgi:hypothetical protein